MRKIYLEMTVHEAVRALREASGESQQIFATRLGMSIRALGNYEKHRRPQGKAALSFISEAARLNRWDLSVPFGEAIAGSIDPATTPTIKVFMDQSVEAELTALERLTSNLETAADMLTRGEADESDREALDHGVDELKEIIRNLRIALRIRDIAMTVERGQPSINFAEKVRDPIDPLQD